MYVCMYVARICVCIQVYICVRHKLYVCKLVHIYLCLLYVIIHVCMHVYRQIESDIFKPLNVNRTRQGISAKVTSGYVPNQS